jgi:hypothetical protein
VRATEGHPGQRRLEEHARNLHTPRTALRMQLDRPTTDRGIERETHTQRHSTQATRRSRRRPRGVGRRRRLRPAAYRGPLAVRTRPESPSGRPGRSCARLGVERLPVSPLARVARHLGVDRRPHSALALPAAALGLGLRLRPGPIGRSAGRAGTGDRAPPYGIPRCPYRGPVQ